ncbi:phospholipase D-like domain-containing protein [soil metagenome]
MEAVAGKPNLRPAPPPRPTVAPRTLPPSSGAGADAAAQRAAGTSPGVNIRPGSDDDGWIVPSPVALEDGTRLQLYKDGEALRAAFDAIKHARRRVCLQSYIFADDETGRAFADLLIQKVSEHVPVYLIYDSFGSFDVRQLWRPKPVMFERMRRAGVRMQEFHPVRPWEVRFSWRPVNRDHRKLLVVDDERGGLGGLNVGREYAGSWVMASQREADHDEPPWRDNAVGVVGPGAKHLLAAFKATWSYCARGGRIRRAEYLYGIQDQPFGLLASVPTVSSPLRPFLCNLIHDAKKSIEMTMAYFAPDDQLINELIRAAKKRNVRVRLMLPAKSDVTLLIVAAHSFYDRLMDAGVEIYERQSAVLHAKTICIDECISVIGSTNLDTRSIEYNCELSAIVRNETFGKQMHELFENDVCYAKRIDPAMWRARPWRDRVIQWSVSRARYLL